MATIIIIYLASPIPTSPLPTTPPQPITPLQTTHMFSPMILLLLLSFTKTCFLTEQALSFDFFFETEITELAN